MSAPRGRAKAALKNQAIQSSRSEPQMSMFKHWFQVWASLFPFESVPKHLHPTIAGKDSHL